MQVCTCVCVSVCLSHTHTSASMVFGQERPGKAGLAESTVFSNGSRKHLWKEHTNHQLVNTEMIHTRPSLGRTIITDTKQHIQGLGRKKHRSLLLQRSSSSQQFKRHSCCQSFNSYSLKPINMFHPRTPNVHLFSSSSSKEKHTIAESNICLLIGQ